MEGAKINNIQICPIRHPIPLGISDNSPSSKDLTYIDLFAGAGGLSEGFIKSDFIPVAHVEIDKDASETLKTRLSYHYLKKQKTLDVYFEYIQKKIKKEDFFKNIPNEITDTVINTKISKKNFKKIILGIKESLKNMGRNSIDIIVGGPPCQAYSLAGRAACKNGKKDDERNYLYIQYARFLTEFKPKVFVFENVPGIYNANDGKYYKNLKKYYRKIGYCVEDKVLDASDFGVLQKRRRVIIIGWRKDLNYSYPDFERIDHNWTSDSLFNDLPFLKAGEVKHSEKYRTESNEYLKKFQIRNGVDFVTQNITRPHNKKDLQIYLKAIEMWEKDGERIRNDEIPSYMRTQKNVTSFLDRFKVVVPNIISHTLIAHIAKDGHYYIHPDKAQLRSLSVREAARIQSFSDDYFFEGSRTSAFKQIGNAVPPLMAENIANNIKKMMINE